MNKQATFDCVCDYCCRSFCSIELGSVCSKCSQAHGLYKNQIIMNEKSLEDAWRAFSLGNRISDKDLFKMRDQILAALPLLTDRIDVFYLAAVKARMDLITIEGYLKNRGLI